MTAKIHNTDTSNIWRTILHEAIKDNHEIIKRGCQQKINGFDKI